jgi:outer membrane immunogenic protein
MPVRADPPPQFAGGYAGLNAGGAWGSSKYATDPGCVPITAGGVFCVVSPDPSVANGTAVAAAGSSRLTPSGFTGGIQGGYNWQSGTLVYGGEADFGALDLSRSVTATGAFPFVFLGTNYTLVDSVSAEWLATLRGRIGMTVTPQLMLYATGGIAFTDVKISSSYSDNAVGGGFPGGTGYASRSDFRTGWTVGGGGEWRFDSCWSLKAEYLYVDFGSKTVAVAASNTPAFTQTMQIDADLSAQIARVGLNYFFD